MQTSCCLTYMSILRLKLSTESEFTTESGNKFQLCTTRLHYGYFVVVVVGSCLWSCVAAKAMYKTLLICSCFVVFWYIYNDVFSAWFIFLRGGSRLPSTSQVAPVNVLPLVYVPGFPRWSPTFLDGHQPRLTGPDPA